MNMDVSPYIWTFKFFSKNTCSTTTAWIQVGLLKSKSEMIYLPKQDGLISIHIDTTHILDMSWCRKHQHQRYVCSYIICMLIYFSL